MGHNHGAEPLTKAVKEAWEQTIKATDKVIQDASPTSVPSPQPPPLEACSSLLQCLFNVLRYVFTRMDLIGALLNLITSIVVVMLLYYCLILPLGRRLAAAHKPVNKQDTKRTQTGTTVIIRKYI